MKNILVTGASGYIGRKLCESLSAAGYQVRALLRKAQQGPWHESMIGDLEHLPQDLMKDIDTVFHLAGKVHALQPTWHDDEEQFRINAAGTRRVVQMAEATGVQRLIYFSTLSVLGLPPKGEQYDEDGPKEYQNIYGLSKYYTEQQYVLHNNQIPHIVVLRPAMVYGAGAKGNLNRMIDAMARGRFLALPESHGYRSMVHIDDVVEAAILSATCEQAAGKVYNITDQQPYSSHQLYVELCQVLGKQPAGWTMPLWGFRLLGWLGDVIGVVIGRRFVYDSSTYHKLFDHAQYDSSRIERELGFKPRYCLSDSLREIVDAQLNAGTEGR